MDLELPTPLSARPGPRSRVATLLRTGTGDRWLPATAFAALAGSVILISQIAFFGLEPAVNGYRVPRPHLPGDLQWLGPWAWWDGAWYTDIARRGYSFTAGPQSPVAFFPAYPMLMRALSVVVGHPTLAGFVITLAAGFTTVVLFHRWCLRALGHRRARLALAALLLYPCSFYLTGKVYADALFLAAALGAFTCLERDRPLAAGILGALATATRPTGVAVAIGLWLRAAERRRAAAATGVAPGATEVAPVPKKRSTAWLLLAPAGLAAYSSYLALRFGNPLAFAAAGKAWGQSPGPRTWFKAAWFERMASVPLFSAPHYHLIGSAAVTLLAIALIPRVVRRFGPAYGVFTALMVLGAAVSTRDFIGMGRYVLVAFPCFAAAGDLLGDHPSLVRPLLVGSATLLLLFAQLHARSMLIS